MDIVEIKRQMELTLQQLDQQGASLKEAAFDAANCAADYEEAKNTLLLRLKDEEIRDPTIKRTVQDREAIYRDKLKAERRARAIAANVYETEKIQFRGISNKLTALQTLAKIEKTDFDTGNFR